MAFRLTAEPVDVTGAGPADRGDGPAGAETFTLQVRARGTALVLVPQGRLDGEAGQVLEEAARALAAAEPANRLMVDLAELTATTPEGRAALRACARLGAVLDGASG